MAISCETLREKAQCLLGSMSEERLEDFFVRYGVW